ncbi:MAG: hypothetical protein EBZ74_06360 [Planctomycetia bacterium]|nr:hypothetical protein [Planctomycetia bacterium]
MTTISGRRQAAALVGPAVAAVLVVAWLAWSYGRRPAGAAEFIFPYLTARYDVTGGLASLAVLVVALAARLPAAWENRAGLFLEGLVDWLGRHPLAVAAATAPILDILAIDACHGYAVSMDEYAALFQARIFAAGRLVGQWPPALVRGLVNPGHVNYFIVASATTGEVMSCYSPGHALLMAPCAALDAPWACNAVLSAASLPLIASTSRRLFGGRAAGWAVLLTVASPVFMAYGVTFYSMAAHCLLNLAFASLLLAPTPLRALAAGLVGGYALVLHQPFCHAVFGLPWIAWLASRPARLRVLPLLAAGYLAVYVPIGWGWDALEQRTIAADAAVVSTAVTTTEATAAPPATGALPGGLEALLDRGRGALGAFHIPDAWHLWIRLVGLAKLVVWDAPGLLPLACLGAFAARRRPPALLLAASAGLTLVGYVFVIFDQGHGWGYRYFHSAWGCLPILASAALVPGSGLDPWVVRRVGLAALASLVLLVPLRALQIEHFVAGHVAQEPAVDPGLLLGHGTRVLVFVRLGGGFNRFDMVQNDPFLRKGPIRLVGRDFESDEANAAAIAAGLGHEVRLVSRDERGSVWLLMPPTILTREDGD